MPIALEVIEVGDALGVALPLEVLSALNAKEGDTLTLVHAADGFYLKPHDPNLEKQLEEARQIARERRDALSALAKGPYDPKDRR